MLRFRGTQRSDPALTGGDQRATSLSTTKICANGVCPARWTTRADHCVHLTTSGTMSSESEEGLWTPDWSYGLRYDDA